MFTLQHSDAVDAAYEADLDEDAIRGDYSGRGMYGRSCFGVIVGSIGQAMDFAVRLADVEPDFPVREAQSDGMGHDLIVYWPGVALDGAPDDEEGNDE